MSRSGRSSDGHPTKIAGLYDLEETLGRGHFAVVKLARHVFTGEKVAVKVIDKTKLDPVSQDHLYQEVRCMKLVQHPNVVRLYEVIDTNSKLYLILELGDGGDLYDYIMKHEAGLSEMDARDYFAQIVRAISFCHKLHVVHRDLKPENVVFFERLGIVKLTDFGFSNRFNPGQKLETSCGSLAYSAPEILLGDSYDAPAVDVWSLGVILYMLVAGRAPFQEANDSETLTMIMDVRYRVPEHVSEQCKRLIGRMLVRDPQARATLGEIASDPWLEAAMAQQNDLPDLPLVSRETVSEEDHQFILTKMVNGKIASKEDILEALDKDEYNHITATYYLLAERKLRLLRAPKKPPTHSSLVSKNHPVTGTHSMGTSGSLNPPLVNVERCSDADGAASGGGVGGVSPSRVNQALLSMSRHPGDVASRSRKCSIVTEEEDDEEDRESGGVHDRRGSRSEGKLNLAVAELRRESILLTEASTAPTPLMLGRSSQQSSSSSTGSINGGFGHVTPPVLNKTLPASLSTTATSSSLDGISEEGGSATGGSNITTTGGPGTSRTLVHSNTSPTTSTRVSGYTTPLATSNTSLTSLVKLSFRKSRTASVSSSEASDEDEARHSRRGSTKSLGGHHQPPPGPPGDREGGGTGGQGSGQHDPAAGSQPDRDNSSSHNPDSSNNNINGSNSGGGSGSTHSNSIGDSVGNHGNRHSGARHKRRGGETRLRESQSLNRITEVVETEVGERLSVGVERVISACASAGGNSKQLGGETETSEGERGEAKESECFRCCMEEMCSIEKRLVCERRLSGADVEQNNNVVSDEGKSAGDGCEDDERRDSTRTFEDNARDVSERLGQSRDGSIENGEGRTEIGLRIGSMTGIQNGGLILSPSGSAHSQATSVHSSGGRNLTNVYSRHNKYRYIHSSNTTTGGGAGGGKTNCLISSISYNDIPDGCQGNDAGRGNDGSNGGRQEINSSQRSGVHSSEPGGQGGSHRNIVDNTTSKKCNTITRLRNRHNKENSSSGCPATDDAECKQKSPLPSNGLAGTNKVTSTSNGKLLTPAAVVNKNKKSNKNTLINRYLYLQKKLVMPLFGGRKATSIKSEGRLYKAKSCSEVEKTSCTGGSKVNVLSKTRGAIGAMTLTRGAMTLTRGAMTQTHGTMTLTRCSKHVTECTTGPLKVTASIVNIDHRTSTLI